ncbi:MAG TPA: glycoside hydrolase family 43 protein [Acidimicrobiales bacterium]|nr:glycoside hydrolase family 43 protein [Acidimicrobiales bacterium]
MHPGDFPDPSILAYDGTYYGFATQSFAPSGQTVNVQESTSTDGVTWTSLNSDALPHLPAWARSGNTWAPTVAYNGSKFVMYYAATQASDGDQCIGLALASSPGGPYVDNSSAPAVCQNGTDVAPSIDNGNYGGSIDPDIFTDKGVSTLIWKSDSNHIGINASIWSQPLSASLTTFAGTATQILQSDQPWQNGIVEGPDMTDRGGTDYLFYSGGDEGSANYAIGYALCAGGPSAVCTDGSSNPIQSSAAGMSGPGGPAAFSSPGGQLMLAFAAWQGTTVGYLSCGIRPMYLATVTFGPGPGGVPSLSPGTSTGSAGSPACAVPPPPPPGYWQVASDGGVFSFGSAHFYGSTGSMRLNKPVVGMAATADRKGYWLVASDGGVFTFGDAGFYGSTGSQTLNKPIVGMVPSIDGRGYWLVASDGGVFTFGDARFYGSTGADTLSYPITAMAPGYLGGGYWLVDANGQVFSFGDAAYAGQPPFAPGGYRITGMASTGDTDGYWLASANGNVANFGDAPPDGSLIGQTLNGPIVGMSATADGGGYWLQGSDGGIFCFGKAAYEGSMGGQRLNAPMVGMASM